MTEPLKGAIYTDAEEPPERLRARLLDDEDIDLLAAEAEAEDEDEDEEIDDDAH